MYKLIAMLILIASVSFAQDSAEQIIEKVTPSVAAVLVGNGTGNPTGMGSAVVTHENGVLLTAYHLIKNAAEVQIRFKDGETFDNVQLLGVDQRRDVAAIRIMATHLPALPVKPVSELKVGSPVYVVSSANGLPWTASSGIVSAFRLADEVAGAGSGYRLVQFTAPISPGSSGGMLVDANAHLIGIIVGLSTGGQNLNFAVPIESVLGLGSAAPTLTFRAGNKMQIPATANAKPAVGLDLEGPERSEALASRDPKAIMQKLRTVYARSKTVWMNQDVLKNALRRQPDIDKLGLVLVESPKLADVLLVTDRALFTWDWTYTVFHQNTSIVLTAGKFTRIDGMAGAAAIAEDFIKKVKEARLNMLEEKKSTDLKSDQNPKQK